jgi:hypothetical protein
MPKIYLKSIQNKGTNDNDKVVNKPSENNVENVVVKKEVLQPDFNDFLNNLNIKPVIPPKQQNIIPIKTISSENEDQTTKLSDHKRNKLIGLLYLYIAEFPDKLKAYKSKNFHKIDDNQLCETKKYSKKK